MYCVRRNPYHKFQRDDSCFLRKISQIYSYNNLKLKGLWGKSSWLNKKLYMLLCPQRLKTAGAFWKFLFFIHFVQKEIFIEFPVIFMRPFQLFQYFLHIYLLKLFPLLFLLRTFHLLWRVHSWRLTFRFVGLWEDSKCFVWRWCGIWNDAFDKFLRHLLLYVWQKRKTLEKLLSMLTMSLQQKCASPPSLGPLMNTLTGFEGLWVNAFLTLVWKNLNFRLLKV